MAYSRQDSTAYALDGDYMTSPLHRPLDAFPGKGADPLSGNWNYDNAIDLFSLNPTTMMPEPLPLDIPSEFVNLDPKEFPADFFAPAPEFSGFTISNNEDVASCGSISSDLESDDQSWSPSYVPPTETSRNALPEPARRNTEPALAQKPQERAQRWSSSPDIAPQEYPNTPVSPPPVPATLPATTTRKMTRSLSGDSHTSGTGATTSSGRNAAKRAAHNIIEKRYRTNMNAKFVALEKAMCGGVQKQSKAGSASLKKSEILSNAITYMQELQEENKALRKEMEVMKQNMMWRRT